MRNLEMSHVPEINRRRIADRHAIIKTVDWWAEVVLIRLHLVVGRWDYEA